MGKYDALGSDLRCPSAEIVNRLWFKFLEEDLTQAPIGANVKRSNIIPLGLKAAIPQCFAPETTNSLIAFNLFVFNFSFTSFVGLWIC